MADKITKLTSTVYNVLEFFPYEDPLKTKAKEKALAIMENSTFLFMDSGWVSLKECFSGNREKIKFQIIEDIDILLNCLKLAKLQGWISNINFLIIFNEYEKIRKEIKPKGNPIFSSIEFSNLPRMGLSEKKVKDPAPNIIKPKKEVSFISERQKKIIKVLEERGRAQVMDFKTVLGDITKRTIRRDLDELLKMGKITREGEFNQVFYKILH
ncbi:MAG: DeoR family transcriptional regulator [Patescibacteria group bacterium]